MKKLILFCIIILAISYDLLAQWNYGSPISTNPPASTWRQVVNRPPLNEMMDSLTFPYPTNAWFNNFFLGQQPYPGPFGLMGANKVHPYPYQLALGNGYGGYPNYKALLAINYKPFAVNTILTGQGIPVTNWDNSNFAYMGTTEPLRIKPSMLNDYTELSTTIRFTDSTFTTRYYYSPIVRGMPYVTMIYNSTKPGVYFPSPAILKVNDTNVVAGMNFTNRVFKIETGGVNNTSNRPQTWILISSVPITLQYSISAATQGLISLTDFTGWLRLANLTYQGENLTAQQLTDKINLLTAYAKFIPVKAQLSASYTSGSTATMQYTFTRYNEGSLGGSDSLLMMALPHHQDMLTNPLSEVLKYDVLKGRMKEVRQKVWNMTENLMPDYTFYPKNARLQNVPLQWCDTLERYINNDFTNYFNRNWLDADIYGMGKNFQRIARVIVIADELYERDNSRYASMLPLSNRMRDTLKLYLGNFLNGRHTLNPVHGPGAWDSVFYDTKYGGLISSLGWDSLNVNCCFSYGSAVYNDHHFHYGYPIYAASIIAKKDPAWFTANSNYYFNRVSDLIRDIANPSKGDGRFALMRYKDWFEGHSWANGLVPFGDGKNQESSSESVNAWYGIYLFGSAMSNDNIKNTGGLGLAQEIRSVKKYYHITLPQVNPVYPTIFTNKLHIATNLYSSAIDGQTFFGTTSYTVHGIHIIPVSPVTEALWDYNYSKDIYDYASYGLKFSPSFDPNNTNVNVWQWTTICMAAQSIAYPQDAWDFFPRYGYNPVNYDNGTTQSAVVYWLLTRLHGVIGIQPISNEIPGKFTLNQNYPNPFNPVTNINFSLPKKSFVKLVVYDALGREIAMLVNDELVPGIYKIDFNASQLASGVYFYRLDAGDFTDVKKMMLVK
jgi:endo-1,3(4)-beta-glucanase